MTDLRYAAVTRCVHTDANVQDQLSKPQPCGWALWMYLLTCTQASPIPGVIRASKGTLADYFGWSLDGVDLAYGEVSGKQPRNNTRVVSKLLAKADWKAGLIWLPNASKHGSPRNPNQVKGWRKWWAEIPDCPLKNEVYEHWHGWMKANHSEWLEAFYGSCGRPEDLPAWNNSPTTSKQSESCLANPEPEPEPEPENPFAIAQGGVGGAGSPPAREAKKTKRKTKAQTSLIADDWWPDAKLLEWARGSEAELTDAQVETLTREFVRYWQGRTDGRAYKSERGWRATWQNRATAWREKHPGAPRWRPPAPKPPEPEQRPLRPDWVGKSNEEIARLAKAEVAAINAKRFGRVDHG